MPIRHTHLRINQSPSPENNADRKAALFWTMRAQLLAQKLAQLPPEALATNTHDDTAGLVILHQQYLLSSLVELVVIESDFVPILLPFWDEQPAIPDMATFVLPVVQFADQSNLPVAGDEVHVVEDEFNATHFVAACAVATIVILNAANNTIFEIFIPKFLSLYLGCI